MPEVFANTTPLQYLHRLGRLDWLRDFYGRVVVPEAVAAAGQCRTGFQPVRCECCAKRVPEEHPVIHTQRQAGCLSYIVPPLGLPVHPAQEITPACYAPHVRPSE